VRAPRLEQRRIGGQYRADNHSTAKEGAMGILQEFKDFLMKGNLIELAVAFVLGIAFAALLNAFVADIIMPIIGAIFGKVDFSNLSFTIHKSLFKYGAFITALIQFVTIAAAVLFFIVKPVQIFLARRSQRDAEVEAPSDEERRHQELLAALRGVSR
jgi:large conductance mechanosensitive channel